MPAGPYAAAVPPWSLFGPHHGKPFAFFLDRGLDPERPSFAGSVPCSQLVVERDGRVRRWNEGCWSEHRGDPVEAVADFLAQSRAEPLAAPAWMAGAPLPRTVGFLAYELGAWADGPRMLATRGARREPGTPLVVLSTYDRIDAWDPATRESGTVVFRHGQADAPPAFAPLASEAWESTPRDAWERGMLRVAEAIAAGDIYQANLSRRVVFAAEGDPAEAYARLRSVQPVPWGAFLDLGGFALLSNSPECFLEKRGDCLRTRPIKGTRPRRTDPRADDAEAAALLGDAKENAEHVMIVDLERSDLGRVAVTGSVRVSLLGSVERYATVHHMESEVVATMRPGLGLADVLRATFPGGSITGAPKIRAMEILAEVEDDERGPYTGAIGFFDGERHADLSIAIRTALWSGGRMLYATGGGIVADSEAGREWDETELKVDALRRSLALGAAASAGATTNAASKETKP